MTNEQTAVMLGGYLKELREAIEVVECFLQPTMVKNIPVLASISGIKERETYPQIQSIADLANRLEGDIDNLNGIVTITSGMS